MGLAGALRPVREGFYRAFFLRVWGDAALSHGRNVRRGVLLADIGPGDPGPYPHGLYGCGGKPSRHHARARHQPERGDQDGQAQDHRSGRHEDPGAEEGRPQRLRSGYPPVRPLHLRRRGEKSLAGSTEPQRANVQYDLPHAASGAHEAKAGDRRFPVGQHRPDPQLHPDPAGLSAGGRPHVLAAAWPQPYQDRTQPHHIGTGGVRALRDPGALYGRGRHVLRAQRPVRQHDPAGPQAVPMPQRPCVRHAGQRQIHELQAGDHLCHADHEG